MWRLPPHLIGLVSAPEPANPLDYLPPVLLQENKITSSLLLSAMESKMMPVIRVSDATWERLKAHARPFEDKPEDVVVLALDALDEKAGYKPSRPPKTVRVKEISGKKLPQKEFRLPLMKAVLELGGSADVSDVRRLMEKKIAPQLSNADYEPVSGGDPRWWNAICWERANLVREGLFVTGSTRGVWQLSEKGKELLRRSA